MDANTIPVAPMKPDEVLAELRYRERLHNAALLAEQENADARVLAEYRDSMVQDRKADWLGGYPF